MAACTQSEPDSPAQSGAMEFDVAGLSRAQSTTANTITNLPFAVYGDMAFASKTVVFNGSPVTYSSSKGWTYADRQYWMPKHEHSFVALHPYGSPLITDDSYSDSRLEFTYTYPDDYRQASDALIAAHRRKIGDDPTGKPDPVRFSFAHILTNVNVMVAYKATSTGPTSITVDGLTFKNIPMQSTYAVTPAPLAGGGSSTGDWTNDEGTQRGWTVKRRDDLKIAFDGQSPRTVQTNEGEFPLFSERDALLLLPNPGTAPAELELNYTTSQGDKESVSADIPRGWNPGTSLTLSLKIDNGVVQFSITVEDWKSGDTTETTVPRK